MKKAALHSLGCKVNSYETEAMQQMLADAGYEIVPFSEQADLYIINTCSVTNVADRKSRQMIHRARKMNPDAIVVAAGCYVQTSTEQAKEDSAIDIIVGNNKKQDLLELIAEYEQEHHAEDGILDINEPHQAYEELKVSHPAEHTRAFLKVQDGCNQFCSYCIIPYARGRVRSRRLEDVVEETKTLAANGFKEVVLTGIHLSSYGIDHGSSLLALIRAIHAVDGIERIRLGSLEPGIITRDFVEELVTLKKVCPHFHLSLQSGSKTVLKRMNRKYTPEEYLEKCEILREYYEHPAFTTDVIVGFPGETPEEFEETCEFVKQVGFYEIHVFKYSKRDGTVAAKMPDQIPESVKTQRSAQLMELAGTMKEAFVRWYESKTVPVLFEEEVTIDGRRYYEGFTPEYVKVWHETDENLGNRIMEVEFFTELY
jgi:threonylcarbamoyladenosine tRNA methylthiotransferase MtaB